MSMQTNEAPQEVSGQPYLHAEQTPEQFHSGLREGRDFAVLTSRPMGSAARLYSLVQRMNSLSNSSSLLQPIKC